MTIDQTLLYGARVPLANGEGKIKLDVQSHLGPPVADNFQYHLKHPASLPTIGKAGVLAIDADVDARAVTATWLDQFVKALSAGPQQTAACFLPDGHWRDKTIVSWDYHTFTGTSEIEAAVEKYAKKGRLHDFTIIDPAPKLDAPYPDLSYVQAHLAFKTDIALGTVLLNLVLTETGYKAWYIHTVLEGLIEFPPVERADGHMTGALSWSEQRAADSQFEGESPEVLIVGAGHNGLVIAARLQALGVKALIVERNTRVGDNWRNRYEALSLHFPYWADHLPYMPYPDNWPLYCPAQKLGNWLESYADALDLKIWLQSSILGAQQDEATGEWTVRVDHGGREERVLHPKHVIMATSLCGVPMMPSIPGTDVFKGVVRHSTEHDSSKAWVGKKVLVVGTSSSGFDTTFDFSRRGVDVTMLQRSPTYIMSLEHSVPMFLGGLYKPPNPITLEVADRIANAMPVVPGEELSRRAAEKLEELDKDMLDGLEKAGFKTYRGQRKTGVSTLGMTKAGGFFFSRDGCKDIVEGKVKLEQGYVEKFTENEVILNGGRPRKFDLVVMATGFSNTIDSISRTLGPEIASRTSAVWGVDEEGELRGAWRPSGVKGLWIMVGTLQLARFHSIILSNTIKAELEGIAPK